jgi:hypothetical protein
MLSWYLTALVLKSSLDVWSQALTTFIGQVNASSVYVRVSLMSFAWPQQHYKPALDEAMAIVGNYLVRKVGKANDPQLLIAANAILDASRHGIDKPLALANKAIVAVEREHAKAQHQLSVYPRLS